MKTHLTFLHALKSKKKISLNFDSTSSETEIFNKLKLKDYSIYQFIQHDCLSKSELKELDSKNIKYYKYEKTIKTWFRLSSKIVFNILILPQNNFFYQYICGNYFYLYTKETINKNEFESWLNSHFKNPFPDFDDAYYHGVNDNFKFINSDDYILITGYDYQKDFGITAKDEIIKKLQPILEKENNVKIKLFDY